VAHFYGGKLAQFYSVANTPYTPEQNGLVERFFRSLKEECVWLHNFGSLPKLTPPLLSGSNGTTPGVLTRHSDIAAHVSFARYISNSWLDIRGACMDPAPCARLLLCSDCPVAGMYSASR